ncbi:MAG TPA: YfiR family protein [Fimbriimonadaceae bacterium]|nr:YfiR family protein [Fimbriimonadaceae bacterium]HRJ95160.1 YfiR family protein [Fimbriimonadaceae bacterium]
MSMAWRLSTLIVAAVLAGTRAEAQSVQNEYDVKAAFIYNFTKYIEWPSSALPGNAPIVIGIVGRDPFGRSIDVLLQGKTVSGRSLRVSRLNWGDDEVMNCHVLFVSAGSFDPARLAKLRGRPILTVGESPGFTAKGGIINFVIEGGRVRFDVNPDLANAAGIQISSKLLSLARSSK